MINRREFLGLLGGVTVVGLSGCTGDPVQRTSLPTSSTQAATSTPTNTDASPPANADPFATVAGRHRRVLVLVQLNGGNDGLNTLIPAVGHYHDARPTIAIAEADRVALQGRTDFALHPALAPLAPLWAANKLAFIEGVGFPDQNRSHFVAMDQWWRADNLSATKGWLGAYLASLPSTDPLYATALNSGAPLLLNATNQASIIYRPSSFHFNKAFQPQLLRTMTAPLSSDPLHAAAQTALARSIGAVTSFAEALNAPTANSGRPTDQQRGGGASLSEGLATAAKLIINHSETRIVVVSAGGFDTHANQLIAQKGLLTDLAAGLQSFTVAIDQAGMSDDVLVVTTSEFGRRVAENGSGGTDHGTGNVSLMLGTKIVPGIHGELDMTNLVNGDIRPGIDPRTIYTTCLAWLGADPNAVLGKGYNQVTLLNPS